MFMHRFAQVNIKQSRRCALRMKKYIYVFHTSLFKMNFTFINIELKTIREIRNRNYYVGKEKIDYFLSIVGFG